MIRGLEDKHSGVLLKIEEIETAADEREEALKNLPKNVGHKL